MKDFIVVAGLFILVVGGGGLVVNFFQSYSCRKYQDITGRETQFIWFDDCYVKYNDEWFTDYEYAAIIIAREGLAQ